ncbi:hypothetical protein H0W32_00315 [Patescibacteria group bacterium]|nr:hypothetical protein [Patescibacteria group bacterium]
MNDSFEILKQKSAHVGLNPEERQSLKSFLNDYIDSHPILESEIEHSPISPFSKFFSKIKYAGAFAGVAVLLASSVAYAAEGSLPGDMLYPVKVGFNEKIQGVFAFTAKSKATHEINLVNRRLIEAESLQDESRLSAGMKATVLDGFSRHMKAVGTHVETMSKKEAFTDVQETTQSLEASLQSHSRILPVLSLTTSSASLPTTTDD